MGLVGFRAVTKGPSMKEFVRDVDIQMNEVKALAKTVTTRARDKMRRRISANQKRTGNTGTLAKSIKLHSKGNKYSFAGINRYRIRE